jgi:hypothetical protein
MMPYGRFLPAAQELGYDVDLLGARFGASFEQVAHRLTMLSRSGARGVPFFMVRVDTRGTSQSASRPEPFPLHGWGGLARAGTCTTPFATPAGS